MGDVDMEFTPREVGIEDADGPDMVFTEREVARLEAERARAVAPEGDAAERVTTPPEAATDLFGGMYDDDVDMVFTPRELGIEDADDAGPDMVFTESEVARADAARASAPVAQVLDHEPPTLGQAPSGDAATEPGSEPDPNVFTDAERDALRDDLARFREANPDASEADVSAWRIRQCWRLANAKGIEPQVDTELHGLDTPEGRMQALDIITQQSSNPNSRGDPSDPDYVADDPTQDDRCGPAAMIGAALYANGTEGLQSMISAMRAQGMSRDDDFLMRELESRMQGGEALTVGDIQSMQTSLYNVMRTQMSQRQGFDPSSTGIDDNSMQHFLNQSPELQRMFREQGMEIAHIDSEGGVDPNSGFDADGNERPYQQANNRAPDHFVLRMTGPDGQPMIYDPQMRQGGQLIDFEEGVAHYDRVTHRRIQ